MDMSLGMSMGIVGTRSVMNERLTPGTSVCPGLSPGGQAEDALMMTCRLL